jgi:predicted nucleic acid-binding protein
MARPEIPDTSALVQAVRRPERWPTMFRSIQTGQVWLSSVVLAELYVGTHSGDDQMILDRITLAARRMDRLLRHGSNVLDS